MAAGKTIESGVLPVTCAEETNTDASRVYTTPYSGMHSREYALKGGILDDSGSNTEGVQPIT